MEAYLQSPQKGLETELGGKKLHQSAKIFLDIAKSGLIKRKELNSNSKDEKYTLDIWKISLIEKLIELSYY